MTFLKYNITQQDYDLVHAFLQKRKRCQYLAWTFTFAEHLFQNILSMIVPEKSFLLLTGYTPLQT